jgi:hypothetical protein
MIKYLYELLFPKKEEPKKELIKVKLDEDNDQFLSIKDFDESDYINKNFDDIFHSIMNTDDWVISITNYEISIKNKNEKLEVKIDYGDLFSHFKIKFLKLYVYKSKYYPASIFHYTDDLDINFYKFVYNLYSKNKETLNNNRKENCDDALSVVKEAIGKSSIRDRRLDELLGSN